MARISNRDRLLNTVADLPKGLTGQVADLIQSIINLSASEDLSDLEASTSSASRRSKKDEKPAKKTKKTKKSKDEDEDEPKAKRGRKSKKKDVEPFDGTPTIDDCYDFLMEFEGEPVSGGVRELKPEVVKLGGDPDVITEDAETRSEKAEEYGMFIAASKALAAKLALHDDEDIEELAEELDVEVSKSKKKTISAIIVALNSAEENDDEDEEDETEEEEEEDEDDEDEAPKSRKGKKGKAKKSRKKDEEDEDEDGLEDIEDID